jgi:hypothetical protein
VAVGKLDDDDDGITDGVENTEIDALFDRETVTLEDIDADTDARSDLE